MALPVYVYSSGDVVVQVLNAITTFINQHQTAIMSIVALIGVPMTVISFLQKKQVEVIVGWALVTILVPTMLLYIKKDVQVIDASNPMGIHSVSNVPYIVSFPSYISTYYMYAMTDGIESIFHVNDDESYSRTGMLFGASLFEKSFKAEISDPLLQNAWTSYVTNCIRPDININFKYTYDSLQKSDNVLEFLANHDPSPLRGIYYYTSSGKTFYTCKQALPKLTQAFNTDARTWFSDITTAFDSNTSDLAHSSMMLENAFDNLQSNIMGISQGSIELTKQIMAINGIQKGLVDATSKMDTWQSSRLFAEAQTEAQSLGFMASTGLWAQKKLPLLHTILTMLIMCGAPVVLGIAMLPNQSVKVLKNYAFGFFWIGSWPIVFAFINFICTIYLSSSLGSLTDADGGITMENLNQASLKNLDAAAISGWLMSLTPVICNYLVKGGASIMQSSAMQFSGMMSSIGGNVSRELGTGNISMGNTSMNNHSFDNMNANKRDLASNFNYHGATANDEHGVQTTTYQGGQDVYNAKPAISQLPLSLNNSDTQRASLSQAVRDQKSVVDSARSSRNEAISETATDLQRAAESAGQADSNGTGYRYDDSSSQGRDLSSLNSIVDDYAKANGMTKSSAWTTLLSGYVQGGAGIELGGFSAGVGAKGEVGRGTSDQYSQQENNSHRESVQEQFNDRLSSIQSASKNESTDHRNTSNKTSESSISQQLSNLTSANKNYESALSKQHSYESALSKANEHSLGANENLDNEFQSYVENQYSEMGAGAFNGLSSKQVLTGTNAEARQYREALVQDFFEDKFSNFGNDVGVMNNPLSQEQASRLTVSGSEIVNEGEQHVNNQYEQAAGIVRDNNVSGNSEVNKHQIEYNKLGEINTESKVVNQLIDNGETINANSDGVVSQTNNTTSQPVRDTSEAFHFFNTDDTQQPNGTVVDNDNRSKQSVDDIRNGLKDGVDDLFD